MHAPLAIPQIQMSMSKRARDELGCSRTSMVPKASNATNRFTTFSAHDLDSSARSGLYTSVSSVCVSVCVCVCA